MKIIIKIFKLFFIMCCCLLMISCNNKNKLVTETIVDIPSPEAGSVIDNNTTQDPENETNKSTGDQNNTRITCTATPVPVTPDKEPTQPINNQSDPTSTPNPSNIGSLDVEAFKNIVINSVNDDLWYLEDGSYFNGFESQTMNMELYTSKKEPS